MEEKKFPKNRNFLKQEEFGVLNFFKMQSVNSMRWNDLVLLLGSERTKGLDREL